ncbi:MJ0042-type zinc finger domain-containing protein [Blastopirellula marina]|uniref:Zinc finger/thioredoxin putative domain-containing protein n=1 Tax=Blastopirellula marina TaxID=124 RepID=A0A2S8GIC8_9BACT|nr:MJ0042-type zinc finger domain-containing protein [Blastopirellula marina]PQO44081.1 hypothetical protein C5Y93_21330 [Blastopirellula marina]
MPIVATCSHCQTTFEANDRLADKRVRCPKCGETIRLASGAATPGAKAFRGTPAMSRNLMDDAEIPIKDPLADRAALSLQKRNSRRQAIYWSVLLGFIVIIGVGIAIAVEKAQSIKLPTVSPSKGAVLPTAPPLDDGLTWNTYEGPADWSVQFPGVPQASSADGVDTVVLDGGAKLGRFLVEVRSEDNSDWNNLTGQISAEEAERSVDSANLLSISDRRSHFAGGGQVHRLRLSGMIPMEGNQAAIVYKFSLSGVTYTVLWQGNDAEAGSDVVRHFFISFQRNGSTILSG